MRFWKSILVTMALVLSSNVNASLIGDSVNYERVWGIEPTTHTFNPQTSIVGAGYEFTDDGSTSDISANAIRIDFTGVYFGEYQYIEWSDLHWVENLETTITGIDVTFGGSITGSSPLNGAFSADNVIFGDHFVRLDVGGITFEDNSFVEVNLQTSAVPIPTAIWLFGSGLIGLVGFARRKQA